MNLYQKMATLAGRILTLAFPGLGVVVSGGGSESNAGERVTMDSALSLSPVFGCIALLAGLQATLPFALLKDNGTGADTPVPSHPLFRLLHDSPNADQTAYDFWEFAALCLELHGNFYARQVRTDRGVLLALLPLRPDQIQAVRLPSGALAYRAFDGGREIQLAQSEVFHVRGFGGGPLGGLSTLALARHAFGLALAQDRAASSIFRNGLRPSGVLKYGTAGAEKGAAFMTDAQRQMVESRIVDRLAGVGSLGRPLVLEGGMSWEALSIPPEDAQMLQSRSFSVEDICRFFGVPPHMIGHTANSTSWGTGLEQQTLGFLRFSLLRRLRRMEQAIAKQLLTPVERATLKPVFNVEGLLRGDSTARGAYLSTMTQNGLMTRNEARAKENLPPLPGGDALTVQSALVPLEQLGAAAASGDPAAKSALRTWLGIPAANDREGMRDAS